MKKIGIITFHNSYNCGSMLESYAIMKHLENKGFDTQIIDYSSDGQVKLYKTFYQDKNIKSLVKNLLILPHIKRINKNNSKYEEFKNTFLNLSCKILNNDFSKLEYDYCIAGSDQIWNITIEDYNDAYFLNWCNNCKKIAYAPSFGSKNPINFANENLEKLKKFMNDFDSISIRENNGQKWIKDMINKEAPVLIDPTLLLSTDEYDVLLDNNCTPKGEYIFLYCPGLQSDICNFIKKISIKYRLPVIAWSAKSFYVKNIGRFGFKLPDYESPAVYLSLIKNAKLIFTTSFHGTIFSTIYKKNFYTIKNGGMFGDDDRVKTLIEKLGLEGRLIGCEFDNSFDYMTPVRYSQYNSLLPIERQKAEDYFKESIGKDYE